MAEQRISVHIPRGHCRSCREAVMLAEPELPTMARNGRLLVKGLCPACGTSVTSFFKATPIERLPVQGFDPAIVGLLATGIKQGFREAATIAKRQRADDMLAVQRELQPTLSALARLFGISRGRVAAALSDARQRENKKLGILREGDEGDGT